MIRKPPGEVSSTRTKPENQKITSCARIGPDMIGVIVIALNENDVSDL
jgi:hypothetical protein